MSKEKCFTPEMFGSNDFKKCYNTKYAYYVGAMANGISSIKMITELGNAGLLGSYGSGGQTIETVRKSIKSIKQNLVNGNNFLINVLASPNNSEEEMNFINMLIEEDVRNIEASAFIKPSKALIYYRLKGIRLFQGQVIVKNRIIAKLSREEVALSFLNSPNQEIVDELHKDGLISTNEANCASLIPLADHITVEADSGGHTDNRPLISLFPAMVALRDQIQYNKNYKTGMGAAGGIATPASIVAAFSMKADYVVTGSINQACIEAETSEYVKDLLCKARLADTAMCPSADMFEFGGKVQVLKLGTMFPQRAQKLLEYYKTYSDLNSIPTKDKLLIEKNILQDSFDNIWNKTKEYFNTRKPEIIIEAEKNPRKKMALVFRWYLGNSSVWAQLDELHRRTDMQIWCGQSIGAFNLEVSGTELELPRNRKVVDIAHHLFEGAASIYDSFI